MLIISVLFCNSSTNFVVFFTLLSIHFNLVKILIIMLSNIVIGGVYMQIFDENPKRICCCNEAIKKGIYAQSLHNDTFSIYGNLMQGSSINIAFTNQNDEWDTDAKGTYYVKIYPDVEKAIIKRYGLDSTPPTLVPDNLPSSHNSLVKVVKEKLISVFSFFKLKRC